MSPNVKPRQPQTVPGQTRTRRTRAAVIEAARTLFLERGYVSTTVEAISEACDTPQATVYRLFSSKVGILKAILDVSIAGDDQPVAMPDRPQVRALLSDPDPRRQLTSLVAMLGELMIRAAPVHRILADAARSDHEAASLLAEMARQRGEGQQLVARSLARRGALRPGLRERAAADIIHALASPEVYGLFVLDQGWSAEHYQTWLRETLVAQLLP